MRGLVLSKKKVIQKKFSIFVLSKLTPIYNKDMMLHHYLSKMIRWLTVFQTHFISEKWRYATFYQRNTLSKKWSYTKNEAMSVNNLCFQQWVISRPMGGASAGRFAGLNLAYLFLLLVSQLRLIQRMDETDFEHFWILKARPAPSSRVASLLIFYWILHGG